MTKDELERLDAQSLGAWDAHDADGFVAVFADDFTWSDWTMQEAIRDRDAARRYFETWMTAFPDMHTTKVTRVVGDDAVFTEIEWSGTNSGPMVMGPQTIPPTGRRVVGRGTYLAKVSGGKVVEFRSHPDVAGIMMQLGLMPGM